MTSKNESSQSQLPKTTRLPTPISPLQRLAVFIIFILLSLMIAEIVIPYARLLGSRYELSRAKEQWQNSRPSAYQVSVRERGFIDEPEACIDFSIDGYIITVIGDEVTSSNAPLECKAVYEQLTIEKSFDIIDRALREANPILAATPMLEFDSTHQLVTYFFIEQAETISSSDPSEWHKKLIGYENFQALDASSNSMLPIP